MRLASRAGHAAETRRGAPGQPTRHASSEGTDPSSNRSTVGNYWPYATTLYDYINRAMPRNAPGSLSAPEVYGLVAWILAKNDIITTEAVMDARTLPAVVMPARDRFVRDDRRGGPEIR